MTSGRTSINAPLEEADDAARFGGFTISFSEGSGILLSRGLGIENLAVVERLELLIPAVSFPLDMSQGIRSLRHRRHLLRRLSAVAFADGLEKLVRSRLDAHGLFRLWSFSIEPDHVALALREADGQGLAFTFRLLPVSIDDGITFLIDAPCAFGPHLRNLTASAAEAVEAIFGLRPDGMKIRLPNVPGAILLHVLPERGWRLPDDTDARLTSLRLQADSIALTYTHPSFDVAAEHPALDAPTHSLDAIKVKEESHILENGDQLVTEGKLEEARRVFSKILDRDPGGVFAAARLAMIDVLNPDIRESALSLMEGALRETPYRRDVSAVLLHGAALQKDAEKEKRALESILDHGNPLERLAAGVRLGDLLLDDAPETAFAIYERAASIRRNDEVAVDALLHAAVKLGRIEKLRQLIPRRIATAVTTQERSKAHVAAGTHLTALNDIQGAAMHYEKAQSADPSNLDAAWDLAETMHALGNAAKAVERLESLTARYRAKGDNEGAARAAARLAEIWLEKGERSLALQRMSESVEWSPNRPERWIRLSEIRTQTGNPEAAAEALETALRKLETTQDDLLEARVLSSLAGIYLYDLSDLEAARNTARKGVERTPPVEACVDILRRVLSQKEATNVSAVTFGTPGEARRVARDFELVGDTHNAYLLLEKAGEKFPENTELVEARIDLARMLNDSDRLYRDLTERIDLPISLRRRADIELELGRMCLEWKANPSAALYWFRSAKEKVPSTRADAGIADAARMLQTQAEKLLADGEAEAADMIFEAVQDDAKSIDTYQSRLDEAEAAADAGNWPRAAELARSLSLAPREIRIKAAIVTARVLAAEGRSELAVQLLEGAALGQDEAGKRLLYIGAVRIQPAHLLNPDAVLQFLLRIHREQPHDAAVDDAVIQMYSMTADKVTLAEYLAAPNTPFDKERYRNAARLFEEAGLHERAAAVLERLYRETDAIDDLFLLAEVFSKIGNREVLIGMLEERRNEDPRVDDLLRQELALYSELLNSSLNPDDAFERNVAGTMDPHRTTPNTSGLLLPISNDAPLPELSPDEDSLDEKLSSAFNRLRIKPKE